VCPCSTATASTTRFVLPYPTRMICIAPATQIDTEPGRIPTLHRHSVTATTPAEASGLRGIGKLTAMTPADGFRTVWDRQTAAAFSPAISQLKDLRGTLVPPITAAAYRHDICRPAQGLVCSLQTVYPGAIIFDRQTAAASAPPKARPDFLLAGFSPPPDDLHSRSTYDRARTTALNRLRWRNDLESRLLSCGFSRGPLLRFYALSLFRSFALSLLRSFA
jgi:hypothetical protein